jgi:hypothetical protein
MESRSGKEKSNQTTTAMKKLLAQDSERLFVKDENTKERGLFSYYLPRIVLCIVLGGLTIYGGFKLPSLEAVDNFFNDIHNQIYLLIGLLGLLIIAGAKWFFGWIKN